MSRLAVTLLVVVFSAAVLSGESSAISYVESSTGLIPPTMEGGRTEVEMADVDNDGNIDLVSIGDHGSPFINTDQHGVMVWFGDGTGSWSVYQFGDFGYGGVALGDVNNDGFMDVGYGMHHNYSTSDLGDQLLEVALGDGSGKFWAAWDDGLATNGETWGMFCTDFADVDNDGDLDIVANSFGAGAGVHVYLNNGDGTWFQSFGFLGGNSTMDVKFGDVNGDGKPDFAVAQQNGTVYMGDGTGFFILADGNLPSPGTMGLYGSDLGDVNGDGTDEVSFCNSNGGLEVWSWADTLLWTDISGALPAAGSYDISQLWDMDVDGYLDVVGFGEGRVTIWKGDGGSTWTQIVDFTVYASATRSAFRVGGDADHNGYPDIVLVEREGTWPSDYNRIRFFKESSVADTLRIRPVFPKGYEKFYGGSVKFIRWVTEVPGSTSVVRLELSTQGPSGPWSLVGDSLADNGCRQWSVLNYVNSDNCYIRYTVLSEGDSAVALTPGPFEIISPSRVSEDTRNLATPAVSVSLFPNPALEFVNLSVSIGRRGPCVVTIYDLAGRALRRIPLDADTPSVVWDGADESGRRVGTGTYLFQIATPSGVLTKKVALIDR